MKFIKQNDKKIENEEIRKEGCFFRSCGIIAELAVKKNLTVKQLEGAWSKAKETGLIGADNCLKDGAKMIALFLDLLGYPAQALQVVEVATVEDLKERANVINDNIISKTEKINWYAWVEADRVNKVTYAPEWFITKLKTKNGTHFIVSDIHGHLVEDPYTPSVEGERVYTICFSIR